MRRLETNWKFEVVPQAATQLHEQLDVVAKRLLPIHSLIKNVCVPLYSLTDNCYFTFYEQSMEWSPAELTSWLNTQHPDLKDEASLLRGRHCIIFGFPSPFLLLVCSQGLGLKKGGG